MEKTRFRLKMKPHFASFRKNHLFIDCILHANGKDIEAHRLILYHHSRLFREYFKTVTFDPQSISISLPFVSSNFEQIIDFCYNGEILFKTTKDREITPNPMLSLFMAYVYGIPPLVRIITNVIIDYLSSLKDDFIFLKQTILHFLSQYLIYDKFIVNSEVNKFPTFSQGIDDIIKSQQTLIDRFYDVLLTILEESPTFLFQCITPYSIQCFLGHPKIRCRFNNKSICKTLDDYFSQGNKKIISQQESDSFHQLLDSSDPSFHTLFNDYEMSWESKSISRANLIKTISMRRETILSLSDSFSSPKFIPNKWNVLSYILLINNSNGETSPSEIDLFDFIGTFGGVLTKPINVIKYRLIDDLSHPSIKKFPSSNALLDTEKYFVAILSDTNKVIFVRMKNEMFTLTSAKIVLRSDSVLPDEMHIEGLINNQKVFEVKLQNDQFKFDGSYKCAVFKLNQSVELNGIVLKANYMHSQPPIFKCQSAKFFGKFL